MPHEALARTTVMGALERLLGSGSLPPPRFGLRLHLRDGQEIDGWTVGSFTLDERLHAPYALTVVAAVHGAEVDLEGLLGGRVTLDIDRGDQRRAVHGVVLEAELVGDRDDARVELRVVPALALSGLSRRSRVFQGVSVLEMAMTVLGPVLAEHGGSLCVDRLSRVYQPRDVCVQYRETDLDFLLRILAAEGITVVFDHGAGVETVVLVDDNAALPVAGREPLEHADEPPPVVPLVAERVDELPIESIQAVGRRSCLGEQATATWLSASSNATALRAGSVFELLMAPDQEYGETWVVTAVRHQGDARHARADEAAELVVPQYGNEIECQPLRERVVPPRMPRPQVMGVCSAIVTGPPGEAIHTDHLGRVRVRMLWDEQEPRDEGSSSCWLRVATPWAGDGFGAVFVPRVGTEVIVSFVDGDPDRPLCSACVHADAAMPTHTLRAADSIVLRCGESRLELHPDRIVLHAPRVVSETPKASLVLDADAATLRAGKKIELGTDVLAAVSTSMAVIKSPTCELAGVTVDIRGERVAIEASARIDIATPGEVDIRGVEMIKLN